jgi:hypothetical protein
MPTLTAGPQSQHTRPNCPFQLNPFRLIFGSLIAPPGQRRGQSGPAPCPARPKTLIRSPRNVRDGHMRKWARAIVRVRFPQKAWQFRPPLKAPHEQTFAAAEGSDVLFSVPIKEFVPPPLDATIRGVLDDRAHRSPARPACEYFNRITR